ncbi:nuclear transport factor 2 family protein [Geothrix sp. 21YS21S-2]|uniref:YybH family protein n=1 Tax=Geothrix sp. 21YS21S-2 TaxID=3068893 RepID=UPI0027B9B0E2|nr:nuclear transport factor 2 family protein [Geothrix sp. 21YS21S-2]
MVKRSLLLGQLKARFRQAPDLPSTLLSLERAALDRSDRLDADGFLDLSDPEVVYIDPFLEQPIAGLENLRSFYRRVMTPSGEATPGEMSHARVQALGDTAVMTYTYRRRDGAGPAWNATEVYHKGREGWRIVHTHWSFGKTQVAS